MNHLILITMIWLLSLSLSFSDPYLETDGSSLKATGTEKTMSTPSVMEDDGDDDSEQEESAPEETYEEAAPSNTGPYGGTLFAIGKNEAYLEMSFDRVDGIIEFYLFEADKDTPIYLEAESFDIHFHKIVGEGDQATVNDSNPLKVSFKAVKEEWESESYVNTSVFTAKEKLFIGMSGFQAEILEITIGEQTFKKVPLLHNVQ